MINSSVATDCDLRYNISKNDCTSGNYGALLAGPVSGMTRCRVFNNVVYKPGGWVYQDDTSGTYGNLKVYNNIFVGSSGTFNNYDYSHNAYSGGMSTSGNDPSPITSSPLFVNAGGNNDYDYKIQSGSPCINAEISVTNNGGYDYWHGILYNGSPDIGAQEYGSVTPTPTSGGATSTPTPTPSATSTPTPVPVAFVTGKTLTTTRTDACPKAGMIITVGSNNLTVTALGRLFITGNTGSHVLQIYDTNGVQQGADVSLSMTGGTSNTFKYANLSSPVTLLANTTYYIVSQETNGDAWYTWDTTVTTRTDASEVGEVWYDTSFHPGYYAGYTYVPVDFKYTTSGSSSTPTPTTTPTPTPAATSTPTPGGSTIGYTTVGTAGNDGIGPNYMNAFKYQAGSNMTVSTMKVYVNTTSTGHIKCAIYADSSGTPGNMLRATTERSSVPTGWQTFNLTSSQSLTSGTYYWLVI